MLDVTKLFMKIVQIDSVSGEEEKMAHYLLDFFKNDCKLHPTIDSSNNVFIQTQGVGEPIFFNCHLDTVEPGRNIVPVLNNGIITSKGNTILGADDKGGVAALMSAIQYISQNKNTSWRPLDILFTTSEETDSYGAKNFDKSKIRAKLGYIFDGTGPVGDIMSAAPYYATFDIKVRGKAAHAGYPEKAIPALPETLNLIQLLRALRTKNALVNIGEVYGGTARNTVIGTMHIKGEIRSFYKTTFEKTVREVKKIVGQKYNCELYSELIIVNPGYIFDKKILNPVKKQLETFLNRKVSIKKSFGISDANIFNEDLKRLTVINLGDGSSHAHTTRESVTVEALETMRDLILKLAKNQEQNNV